jgi:hypothetical protein
LVELFKLTACQEKVHDLFLGELLHLCDDGAALPWPELPMPRKNAHKNVF